MRRWAMNCTIWRSTWTSAPFSASSANAIVEVVIVIFLGQVAWVAPQPYPGLTMATPRRASNLKDLHHLLGHHPSPRPPRRSHALGQRAAHHLDQREAHHSTSAKRTTRPARSA